LNEERQDEAHAFWQDAGIRVSSILIKLEPLVTLRRAYEQNKSKLDAAWMGGKTKELEEYLNEINYIVIDEKIERTIYLKKELAECRTLDAIHIASALEFRELTGENIMVHTFDIAMHKLASRLNFRTNEIF
jgi:predicted nucleic acid-binding protein